MWTRKSTEYSDSAGDADGDIQRLKLQVGVQAKIGG
jgi:hypothetical protein